MAVKSILVEISDILFLLFVYFIPRVWISVLGLVYPMLPKPQDCQFSSFANVVFVGFSFNEIKQIVACLSVFGRGHI
jgi:hypothetical protein